MEEKKTTKAEKELKKLIGDKKLVIGTQRTIKLIKRGRIKKVYISSNCPQEIKDEIERYNQLEGFEIAFLEHPNDELGVLVKKPFSISILSVSKQQ